MLIYVIFENEFGLALCENNFTYLNCILCKSAVSK